MNQASTYPVAMIPYVNMAPYRQLGFPSTCHFVPLVPRKSIAALQRGEVIAAAVPVGGLPFLDETVEPLGKFGIAAKRECMSVMFFSDRPFEEIDHTCKIRITGDSATSIRLLFLLFNKLLGRDKLPHLAPLGSSFNGELLIGDLALQGTVRWMDAKKKTTSGPPKIDLPYATDLATLWRKYFNMPFVFARWVVRRDTDPSIKRILLDWLDEFRRKESDMVAACVEPSAQLLSIDESIAKRYFQVIHRCLDDTDILGQELFMSEFKRVNRDPLFEMDGA